MAMSKVWRYNWKGFGDSNENQQQKSLTTFEHLLEYYKEPLQIHVNNKYTHNDFKHSDELESIRDLYIDFTNNIDDLDSACVIDKISKISSISKMEENVSNLWHQSLILSWFAYSKQNSWYSNENFYNPLFIAINLLRQLQIKETKDGHFVTKYADLYDNALHKSFPIPEGTPILQLPSNLLPIYSSTKVLEVWLTTELEKIAISLQWDNTFWNQVYDQLLHIIPYSLFNMCPILYQMYGYDIVAGSMNHGLVVRSVLFGTHNRITVRASNTISKIWGSHQPDYNQYYTLSSSFDLKNKILLQLPPNIYYIDDKQYDLDSLLKNPEQQQNLAIHFVHQRSYDASDDIEFNAINFVRKVNSLNYSLLTKQKLLKHIDTSLENIQKILTYLRKDENNQFTCLYDITEPSQLLQTPEFGNFEQLVNNVLGHSYTSQPNISFLNFEVLNRRLSKIIDLSSNKEFELHDKKINIFTSSKDNIIPIIAPTNNNKIPMSIIQFAYDLFDLYNGNAKISIIRGNIIIGDIYKHDPNTPDTPDAMGNLIAHEFLDKLKKASEFFTFVNLCKIYNKEYFSHVMESFNNFTFTIVNSPIYYDTNNVESKLFSDILNTVNPLQNTQLKLIDLVSKVKISLNIASSDKTYGLMGLKWFSAAISKLIISLNELTE